MFNPVRPERSEMFQPNACVCPSFSAPLDPVIEIVGPSVSSSDTPTAREAVPVLPTVSVADTTISKLPSPKASKFAVADALVEVNTGTPFCVIVTLTEARPDGSLTDQVN